MAYPTRSPFDICSVRVAPTNPFSFKSRFEGQTTRAFENRTCRSDTIKEEMKNRESVAGKAGSERYANDVRAFIG
jgi:hypothetical protein